jgi:hypothetical protein
LIVEFCAYIVGRLGSVLDEIVIVQALLKIDLVKRLFACKIGRYDA